MSQPVRGVSGPGSSTLDDRSRRRRPLLQLVGLTVSLGATVAVSWFVFGGRAAFQGPDRVLAAEWPLIYGSQALLAGMVGALMSRGMPSTGRWAIAVLGAWIGELIVLTLGGNLLANELDPNVAWFYWWMGTGGPIQPIAAIIGGIAAGVFLRRR